MRRLVWLLMLILLLTGCNAATVEDTTLGNSPVTTVSQETTGDTVSQEEPQCRVFLYADGMTDYFGKDLGSCVVGQLYVYNEITGEIAVLLEEQVRDFEYEGAVINPTIYYVTEAEPEKMYRTTWEGKEHEVVVQLEEGTIDGISGTGRRIAVLVSGCKIVVYDLEKGTEEVLVERENLHTTFGYNEAKNALTFGIVEPDGEVRHRYKMDLTTREIEEYFDW